MLPGGRIRAVITNKGAGDVTGFAISAVVFDQTTRSELLNGGTGLKAGASAVVESSNFTITEPTTVTVTVDPSASIKDANRANNSLSVLLTP